MANEMNNFRIIIYNVELTDMEKAIQEATKAYENRYGLAKTLTVQPNWVNHAQDLIDARDLQLEIDRFFASPGTIQVGE